MNKWLFLTAILIFSSNLFAQEQETVFDYSGLKLTGVWGGPSFGLSGLGDQSTFERGGFGGLEFNKCFTIAFASYWLNNKVSLSQLPEQKLDFTYKGLLLGYALKPQKVIHPKVILLVGGGKIDIEEGIDQVFILKPAGGVEINVFKWCHIDILGGYRLVTGVNSMGLSDQNFSAPFGEIKLRFGFTWGWF